MSQEPHADRRPLTFIDYRQTELNIVSDLKRLHLISEHVGMQDATIQLIDDALQRNREHRFAIAIVGEFKRGKSTFINALLGKEILPADIEPCSATLNRILYGLRPEARVVYRDGRVEEVAIDQLTAYVTKLTPESEQVAATVKEAIVSYPLPYLQQNVELIDTPGLNDTDQMTEVTRSVLPQVAAAIMVVMPEAPFAGSEADFLNNQLLLQDMGRVIFVVTALDRLRKPEDRKRIVEVIQKRINTAVEQRLLEQFKDRESPDFKLYRKQIGPPKVFGLSGYQALEGKEKGDAALLEQSQFPDFEAELERFVTETRGAIELQVLANRVSASSAEIIKKIMIELGSLQMSQQEFEAAYEKSMNDLQALRTQRNQEIALITEAAERTRRRLRPLLDKLGDDLKQAGAKAIDDVTVVGDDIASQGLADQINARVAEALQTTMRRATEQYQIEIERDVATEVNRLGQFAAQVDHALGGIELQFSGGAGAAHSGANMARSALPAALGSLYPLWGGVLAGHQEAGLRGALVGGGASMGAFVAGAMVLAALSAPISLPVVMALGAASAVAGKFAARFTFKDYRVNRFKEQYKTQIFEQIDEQLRMQRTDYLILQHVSTAYDAVKDRLIGELDTSIEQTRSTLDQLRSQKARQETLVEQQRKDSEAMLQEVNDIRSRAQGLSSQLIEIASI